MDCGRHQFLNAASTQRLFITAPEDVKFGGVTKKMTTSSLTTEPEVTNKHKIDTHDFLVLSPKSLFHFLHHLRQPRLSQTFRTLFTRLALGEIILKSYLATFRKIRVFPALIIYRLFFLRK